MLPSGNPSHYARSEVLTRRPGGKMPPSTAGGTPPLHKNDFQQEGCPPNVIDKPRPVTNSSYEISLYFFSAAVPRSNGKFGWRRADSADDRAGFGTGPEWT